MAGDSSKPVDSGTFTRQLSQNEQVYAQRVDPAEEQRHSGLLVGNIGDNHLVIGGFQGTEFAMGERLVLRMVLGNHLIGFQTVIERRFEGPTLYICQFPLKIESVNLRKADRIQAFFPADVSFSKGGGDAGEMRILKTRILDISAGGCNFRSKSKLETNLDVRISFILPGDRQIQSVKAVVLESVLAGSIFNNRVRFTQDSSNAVILPEISRWVTDSMTFTSDVGN
jgi:hypothetical protein